MKFPIDTTNLKFGSGGKPVAVIDFTSKLPKTDENGVPLFKVPLVVITDEGPEIFDVRVVGSLWRGARAAESDSLLISLDVLHRLANPCEYGVYSERVSPRITGVAEIVIKL